MARVGQPRIDQDGVCEACGLLYSLDEKGQPRTQEAYTCDDCGGAVEPYRGELS